MTFIFTHQHDNDQHQNNHSFSFCDKEKTHVRNPIYAQTIEKPAQYKHTLKRKKPHILMEYIIQQSTWNIITLLQYEYYMHNTHLKIYRPISSSQHQKTIYLCTLNIYVYRKIYIPKYINRKFSCTNSCHQIAARQTKKHTRTTRTHKQFKHDTQET